jgi:hypothetical protein
LSGSVQKTFSSSSKHYNIKIYAVKNFENFSTYFQKKFTYTHTNGKPDPMVKLLGGNFLVFLEKHS